MQVFLNVLLGLWAKHKLDAELVIVEWNPPENKPCLQEVLAWPKCLKPGMVRIVEVPKEIHHRLANSDRMPMFEYIAKNVGIRRASGEYVLATNPDIVFSDEIIRYFAAGQLRSDSFYRADRFDVSRKVPLNFPLARQLKFCARHTFRVHRMDGTVPVRKLARFRRNLVRNLPRLLPHRAVRGLIRRGRELFAPDVQGARSAVPLVHTNASGDFFLMRRSDWHHLRGYPELKSHSFVDGYICFMAASLGLRQVLLESPLRIYHQEHDRSGHTTRPLTDFHLLSEGGRKMLESRTPEILNDDDWGLGRQALGEDWVST